MAGLGRTSFRAGPIRSGRDDQAPPLHDGDSAATAASPAVIPQRHHSVEPDMGAHAVSAAGSDPLPEAPASDSTWTDDSVDDRVPSWTQLGARSWVPLDEWHNLRPDGQ